MDEDLTHRLRDTVQAVENVLVASHGPLHDLLTHHARKGEPVPPFAFNSGELSDDEKAETAMVTALKYYGPGTLFNLWLLVRAVEALRTTWTGKFVPLPAIDDPLVAPE